MMRRLDFGDSVLVALTDAAPTPAVWSYSFPKSRLADHPDIVTRWLPDGLFHTRFTVFALVRAGRILVIDAGIGPVPSPYFGGLSGRLDQGLSEAGLDPAAVDLVMFTHFHLDHVGWALGPAGRPFFPKARHVAPEAELAHWRKEGDGAALPHHVEAYSRSIAPLLRAGALAGMEAGVPLAAFGWPDIQYRAVPGHTAGHHAVVIQDGPATLLVAGDAWHSPAQIAAPHWAHRADRDPERAMASRIDLAAFACARDAIVAAGHFPEHHAFGRIIPGEAGGFCFSPLGTASG